jgi:prepilin-type processing-associated H-X9-DG protein
MESIAPPRRHGSEANLQWFDGHVAQTVRAPALVGRTGAQFGAAHRSIASIPPGGVRHGRRSADGRTHFGGKSINGFPTAELAGTRVADEPVCEGRSSSAFTCAPATCSDA